MKKNEAKQLLDKYLSGGCTPEERLLVERAYNLESPKKNPEISEEDYSAMKTEMWSILKRDTSVKITHITWSRIAAAASILLCLSFGGYFLLHKQPAQQTIQIAKQDIPPGGNKATLMLAGGQRIVLTGAKNGLLASQGLTKINKTADGQVVYTASKTESGIPIFNTVITPRGGQYHLVLADGTGVWLNAASSIRYPTTFTGKERKVEITGEAYFEVAHNPAKPFRVIADGQTVEVLGTHFNINAYKDEATITTTLLQGSVKVMQNGGNVVKKLYPGQQSVFADDQIKLSQADTEKAVAWKNGDFMFDSDIKSIMRQIARWYDVDVSYQGAVTTEEFMADISRSKNISEVLKALQLTKRIHFKVEGRSVSVMP